MKSNASTLKTGQYVTGRSSRDTFSSFSASTLVLGQIAVLNGCFAVVRDMEPRAERSSVRFKQRAVIEFLTAEGVSPI
jgi:hypothetical protein